MSNLVFASSPSNTLGIEIELALVNRDDCGLASRFQEVYDKLPDDLKERVKPELMQCYLEINTDICKNAKEADADLRKKISQVERVTDALDLRLYWTATHPFSKWEDQQPTPNERYASLLEILQDMGRQLITFGLHIHVGVDSGDKAIMICDRLMRHLPIFLAASCNSPWWNNRITGLMSHRSKIMESLPTAGLPNQMRNWSEYVWLINHLIDTGFITSIRDIWWDVRPHHNFGTVEVRVCDMPGSLDDVCGLASFVHCLVVALSKEIDRGTYQLDYHPMMVRQNKWRATRYGLDAQLVDPFTYARRSARQVINDLIDRLKETARELDCLQYLGRMQEMANSPTWAERQLQAFKETGDLKEVVRRMTEMSRICPRQGK